MPLVELNNENFDQETEKYELMLLDFWAPWCGPCHSFAPVYEAAAVKYPEILFGRINTELETTLAKQFEIFSIPMLIAAKDGTILYARPGSLSDLKLEALIAELQNGR